MSDLPREIREAVAYTAQHWPRTLTAEILLRELDALARRVYVLAKTEPADAPVTGTLPPHVANCPRCRIEDGCWVPCRKHQPMPADAPMTGTPGAQDEGSKVDGD